MVFDIMRFCVHDGPGIRTTVFLKGCPLHCSWCHNPEGQSGEAELVFRETRCVRCGDCFERCPNGAIVKAGDGYEQDRGRCATCGLCVDVCYAGARELVGREMSAPEVMNEVMKDIAFYDESGGGVTFSGGEPLFQPVFLEALLCGSRSLGIHTAVETTGFASAATLDRLRPFVDLFLYDLKIMDDQQHRSFTGVSNRTILENLRRLLELGSSVVIRIPVIPGVNDHEANITSAAEFIASLPPVAGVHVLPYHRIGQDKYERLGMNNPLPGLTPPGDEPLSRIRTLLERYGLSVAIGG